MPKPFYITTTLPYVNAEPHVGFAMELIRSDIICRAHKMMGEEVFFNTGTDDHGQKIYQKALELEQDPQAYTDALAAKFHDLIKVSGVSEDINFIRTTDKNHMSAVQEFWRLCDKNGYIYKKAYQTKYCVGCELEKTDSELVDGKCPLHPTYELELRDEENYFFKFSDFQTKLLDFYNEHPDFVMPAERFHEIKKFVEGGLQDFSISRLASKMPWGVPVPGDDSQVMYVWFDALVNYISAIGWPTDMAKFNKWQVESGGMVQYCGKDNLRQQTAMWQAMLMAAGLPNSQKVIVEGFITGEGGMKMSKSLGNVVSPFAVVEEFGTDALRYYMARELSMFEDSPFTLERFKEVYNANLANGLGNLVSRVMKMAQDNLVEPVEMTKETETDVEIFGYLERFDISRAINSIWERIGHNDALIAIKKPFSGVKSVDPNVQSEALLIIKKLVRELDAIASDLTPFMPKTSQVIKQLVRENKMPEQPLFLRKD